MVLHYTTLVPSLGQPVRQASVLACEGSMYHPKRERKKERKIKTSSVHNHYYHNIANVTQKTISVY